MKSLFSLICCCFLLINSFSTPSLSKDTLLISNFSVNGLKLGMSINNAEKQLLLKDSVVLHLDESTGADLYYVYYQGKAIMSYNSKNNSYITWIEIVSPVFHTKSNLRIGENITKIIGDLNEDNIEQNENIEQDFDTEYYYFIEENEEKFVFLLFFDEEGIILWIGLYEI